MKLLIKLSMFYANFVVSLILKICQGKRREKNNFLNIASRFRKTLVISIKCW